MTVPGRSAEEKRQRIRELLAERARVSDTDSRELIAIVGMACRYPGSVVDPNGLWTLLSRGIDAVTRVPIDRWDADALYDPDPETVGKCTTREGGFIDSVGDFDAPFFGLSRREAVRLDPQQRLLLETSWEAFEHAGIAPDSASGSATGVFVGLMSHDYRSMNPSSLSSLDGYLLTGNASSTASGRVSYTLGLHGPSLTVDTACSSSLVAVHLACQSLRAGECDAALAAGVTLVLTPTLHVEFSRLRGLAPDGRCKSFSAGADGVGWSEGCGVLLLKRLRDAQSAGDRVLGVIRGSAVNQDGRSNGLTAPNGPAQEAVVRRALEQAGIAPRDVSYVEAHGTGTALGDPIEAQALAAVYGRDRAQDQPLRLGALKSNIGHTQAAAGIAGIIKVVLSLAHEELPPSLHAETLSPHVDWERLPLRVVRSPEPWRRSKGRRIAGVSSFGISGTNAHLIIEEPPVSSATTAPAPSESGPVAPVVPVVLCANTDRALRAQATRLAEHLVTADESTLHDVAHTLARGRARLGRRAVIVASSRDELLAGLRSVAADTEHTDVVIGDAGAVDSGDCAFICTGQGAQYVGMGRELYENDDAFRAALDQCAAAADSELPRPLLDVLFATGADASLDRTDLTQPAMFAIGWSLAEAWRARGVLPSALLGHSVGEYVAACAAGVFSPEDGIRLVAARGRLMQALCAPGGMVAVAADEKVVGTLIDPRRASVSIAAVNSPRQTVIAGPVEELVEICDALTARGVPHRRLTVSHAFHSSSMRPILEPFRAMANDVRFSTPSIPLVSNVTGRMAGEEVASADYWVRHVEASVRFADGVQTLLSTGARTFIEIGPNPTLSAMALDNLTAQERAVTAWLPSMRRGQDESRTMLRAAATAWTRGAPVNWSAATARGTRIPLPTYPFQRARVWIDDAVTVSDRPGRASRNPLLGVRVPVAGIDRLATFESVVNADTAPWIRDHTVFGAMVIPGTAILDWLQSAAEERLGPGTAQIADLVLERWLIIPEQGSLRAQVVLTEDDAGVRVALFTQPADSDERHWTRHAEASFVTMRSEAPKIVSAPPVQPQSEASIDLEDLCASGGLVFGKAFRAVSSAWRDPSGAMYARLRLNAAGAADATRHVIHPVLLDAALRPIMLAMTPGDDIHLPLTMHDVWLSGLPARAGWSRVDVSERNADAISASVTVWDDDGQLIARIGRIEGRRVRAIDVRRDVHHSSDVLYTERLVSLPPADVLPNRRVLIVSDSNDDALRGFIEGEGGSVVFVPTSGLTAQLQSGKFDVILWIVPAYEASAGSARLVVETGLEMVRGLGVLPVSTRVVWMFTNPGTAGAVRAFGRAVAVERPEWRLKLLDVHGAMSVAVAREVLASDDENDVSIRGSVRSVARLTRGEGDAQSPAIDANGPILITGGLGAVGFAIAQHLAESHGARHLILLARRAPDAALAAKIENLRDGGVRVDVVQGDVSNRALMRRVLDDVGTPLGGVIHAAGTADASLLDSLTATALEEAFQAKAMGAWHLHELTLDAPPRFFVLVSSIASVSPEIGQASYAAANGYLDGLAEYRRSLGLAATSVNFGPWAGDGLMQRLSTNERSRLERDGVRALELRSALAGLDVAIGSNATRTVVASLDLDARARAFAGRPIPPLWRSLVHARRSTTVESSRVNRIASLAADERIAVVEEFLREQLAQLLGIGAAADVAPDRPFAQLGIDSLMVIDLRGRIGRAFGVELSVGAIWQHPTVRALATELVARIPLASKSENPVIVAAAKAASRPPAAKALHPPSPRTPIFGVGGGLGGSTYLKEIARELGPLQPFYSSSYPGLEDDRAPMASVQALAAHFVEQFREVHPEGPYALLGHSFGGLVALEMAHQLTDAGEVVLELILLDAWTSTTIATKTFDPQNPDIDLLLEPFIQAGAAPADIRSYSHRFLEIWRANGVALDAYAMRPFEGETTLILPDDNMFGLSPNIDEWTAICPNLKTRRTTGNHATMALAPHAAKTAHVIRGVLQT